ncbi:8351_t:CDS:10 [Entrophospora sp. SA101]|nr:8351_t:CDS:10 [Entrophospora sp. SA101]
MSKKKNKRPKGKANNGNKSKKNQTGGGAPQRRNKTKKHELSADEYTIAQRELEQQLKGIRLYCKDIAGDGNCLFGSLSDQFYGHTKFHSKIRKEICAYLEEKREHFQMFVEDDNTFDYHLSQMKKDGTYGGNMELVAFAQLHNLNIKIYQPNTIFVIRGNESKNIEDSDRIKTLHIAYHNWEHYSSVRKIDGPHEDLLPNSIEKMIMNSTGVNNLIKIRALMEKLDNDQDKVINKLFEEKQQKETDGGNDETNNKDDKGIVKGEVEIGNREDNLILTPKDYLQNDEELNSKASVLSDDKIEKKEEQEDDEECKDKDDLNNIVNDMVNDMVSVVMKDVVKDVVDVMKNDEAIDEKENDVVKNDEMEDDEMEDDMEKDRIESKMKIESSSERNHKSPQKKSSIDSLNSEKDGKSNEENKEISYNSQPKSRKEKHKAFAYDMEIMTHLCLHIPVAQRAYLTGSMKVYSKVAEYNAKTLFSEDYSNIFPSQNGRIEASTDEENNLMFGKGEKDEANHDESSSSDSKRNKCQTRSGRKIPDYYEDYNNSLDVQINIEKTKFLELSSRNIYPLCKPFRELSKENAGGLFDIIADNTAVEFNLPKNIKEYLKDLLSEKFSPLLPLWWLTSGWRRENSVYSNTHNDRAYNINYIQKPSQYGHASRNDAVLYQDKDATILYEQSYGPMEFVPSHQLDDFVKLAKNGVDDLNYHFTHNKNCTTTMAMKFKSILIDLTLMFLEYLISVYLIDIIRVKTYRIYSERWELLNIARFGALLEVLFYLLKIPNISYSCFVY